MKGTFEDTMDISQGDHVAGKVEWDHIPEGEHGCSKDLPIQIAPADFEEEGVPYGAWCKCGSCGLVFRSTNGFDCYGEPGELLKCERCVR